MNVLKKDLDQFSIREMNPILNNIFRSYTKLKEVDDVLGGAAAWENVDSCDEKVNVDKFAKQLFFSWFGNFVQI